MRKIKILVLATIAIIILGIMNTANAAVAIKESGSNCIKGGTPSEYFHMAEGMTYAGQGLEESGANISCHMANFSEFAVLYNFTISNYGVGYEDFASSKVEINGNSHGTSNRKLNRSYGYELRGIVRDCGCSL